VRRVPAALWILLPLAASLLYAAVHPLFAARPDLTDLVPGEAVVTVRYRDLAALNRLWLRGAASEVPADRLGPSRNLPGLAGVDTARPIHLVLLPRDRRHDPSLVIFPVADADALARRFVDPDYFVTKGHVRHAQYLELAGGFAAIGGDREAVRHLGEGGLTAADLGEDLAVAVRVPEALRYAALDPTESPWGEILEALGVDPRAAKPVADETGRAGGALELPAGRVPRVASAWRTARLWAFGTQRRVLVELEPAPGALARRLDALARSAPGDAPRLPAPPVRAQAWILAPGAEERAALVTALHDAGTDFPAPALAALTETTVPGGLLAFADPSPGTGYAWTLGFAAPRDALPDLSSFFADGLPAFGARREIAAGAAPLTVPEPGGGTPSPPATLLRARGEAFDVLLVGATAAESLARFETERAAGRTAEPPPRPEAPWRLVAAFGLSEARARQILGDQLKDGGLLYPLAGGDVEGAILTDGKVLRLEIRARPRG
jgi:hypothetical protein